MPFGLDQPAIFRRQARLLVPEVVGDTLAISRIPAPTGDEHRRALAVRDLFRRDDPGRLVYIDRAGNVVTRIAAASATARCSSPPTSTPSSAPMSRMSRGWTAPGWSGPASATTAPHWPP